MPFGEVSLATNSSNFSLISPHTPMITNAMVVVVKGCNMHTPKLLIMSLGWKNSLIKRSKGGTIITLLVVERSMVQFEYVLS